MRRFMADVEWWVFLPLAMLWLPVLTDSPWSWHSVVWPLAVIAAILALRGSRSRPQARRAASWAVAALLTTGAAQLAIGVTAGVLSTSAGLSCWFELPWGLMWATSGAQGEGIGFALGDGFVLTPFLAALAAGALRYVLPGRTGRQR